MESLPDEMLYNIVKNMNYKSVLALGLVSKFLNEVFVEKLPPLFRSKLKDVTKLDFTHYTTKQLAYLFEVSQPKIIIIPKYQGSFVVRDETIYYLEKCGMKSYKNVHVRTDIDYKGETSFLIECNNDHYICNNEIFVKFCDLDFEHFISELPKVINLPNDVIKVIGYDRMKVLTKDGGIYGSHERFAAGNYVKFYEYKEAEGIIDIAGNDNVLYYLTNDDKVYRKTYFDRDLVTENNKIISISGGNDYLFMLNNIGQIFAYYRSNAVIKLASNLDTIVQISAEYNCCLALAITGYVYLLRFTYRDYHYDIDSIKIDNLFNVVKVVIGPIGSDFFTLNVDDEICKEDREYYPTRKAMALSKILL